MNKFNVYTTANPTSPQTETMTIHKADELHVIHVASVSGLRVSGRSVLFYRNGVESALEIRLKSSRQAMDVALALRARMEGHPVEAACGIGTNQKHVLSL